jgi:hypothetical protein
LVRYDDDIANIRKLQETQQQAVSALAGTVSALTEGLKKLEAALADQSVLLRSLADRSDGIKKTQDERGLNTRARVAPSTAEDLGLAGGCAPKHPRPSGRVSGETAGGKAAVARPVTHDGLVAHETAAASPGNKSYRPSDNTLGCCARISALDQASPAHY